MDGVLIRPIRPEDAAAVNALRRQPGVMENTFGMPSDRVNRAEKFIADLGPDDHVFVATVDGQVVGLAGVHVQRGRRRHVADLGISVHDDYANRGIGRALMQVLLDVADNHLALVRVELEVIDGNARAIHLYESLGFEMEGRKRMDFIRRGQYVDTLVMGRLRPPTSAG